MAHSKAMVIPEANVAARRPYVMMGHDETAQLGTGWHPYEEAMDGRWTTRQATVFCLRRPGHTHINIEYIAPAVLGDALGAAVEIGSRTETLGPTSSSWHRVCLPLPPGPDGVLSITFRVRRPWTGDEIEGNGDRRELGVAVRGVWLVKSPADNRRPPYPTLGAYALAPAARLVNRRLAGAREAWNLGKHGGLRPFPGKILEFSRMPRYDLTEPWFFLKSAYYHLAWGKAIYAGRNTRIRGIQHISIDGGFVLGHGAAGFVGSHEATYLNINGELKIEGWVNMGRGCRVVVEKNAECRLADCGFTALTDLIIGRRLEVGKGTTVSWGCQFLDIDLHTLTYEGKQQTTARGIYVGEHVWIGSRVMLLKGARIPSGCVVAAGSVVTKAFDEEATLIAGNPARVIRYGVTWG